jgi:histidyl-tRNA synthetase
VWYSGPNFRYEKPQQGRYRQFDQVGIEVLGVEDPLLDAEVIALAAMFFARLGLKDVQLAVNSLGDDGDREKYSTALHEYFSANLAQLSEESQITLTKNPLRVLDSKRREDQALINAAPKIRDYLSADAANHFDSVLRALDALGVKYAIDDRLVRGLDYYRRTTFEFVSTALKAAHTAIGGGGRYDGLVEQLGGPATPGIGFALGLDRTLLACDAENVFPAPNTNVSVFVVDTTGGLHAAEVCNLLRNNAISADRAFDNRSMKAQMKAADRSGATIALIIGTDEVAARHIIVRPMNSGQQYAIAQDELVAAIRSELQK